MGRSDSWRPILPYPLPLRQRADKSRRLKASRESVVSEIDIATMAVYNRASKKPTTEVR